MLNADKLIIWCGDSWTKGVGLSTNTMKQLRFTSIISKQLEVPTINLAVSGSSIEHLVYKIKQITRIRARFPNKKILVLFGLTVPYRICIEHENGKRSTVGVNNFDMCGYKEWAVNVFNNREILKRTCLSISWIADQCCKNNINFKFYNILCNQFDFDKSEFSQYLDLNNWLVDPYWSTYSEIYDIQKLNFDKVATLENTTYGKDISKKYVLPDRHPNTDGHNKIAQKLLPEINLLLTNL
jgi:hypothetical protein